MSEIQKTLAERKQKYGDFRGHAELSVMFKDIMRTGSSWEMMPPYMQEALDMVQHKIARILNGDPMYDDSWVDIIGYTQLALDRLRQDTLTREIEKAFDEAIPVGRMDPIIEAITPNPSRVPSGRDSW
jgi:hypothetical protein